MRRKHINYISIYFDSLTLLLTVQITNAREKSEATLRLHIVEEFRNLNF